LEKSLASLLSLEPYFELMESYGFEEELIISLVDGFLVAELLGLESRTAGVVFYWLNMSVKPN